MVDRYPVYRLVQKLQALAWSESPAAGHALADLEAQVDLLLQLGPERRHDPATASAPALLDDQWPREF
jgi:hypothetical protein